MLSEYMESYLAKKKYYDKVLTTDAMWNVYLRAIDVEPIMPYYLWLNIFPFDLAQLGIGLVFSIAGVEFDALMLGFTPELPTLEEAMQGIITRFEAIDWTQKYPEIVDIDRTIEEDYAEEYKPAPLRKGFYGITRYDESYYDPVIFGEAVSATILRMVQMNPTDPLLKQAIMDFAETLGIEEATLYYIVDKVAMVLSCQSQAFILGLGAVGESILQEVEDGFVKFNFVDHAGKEHTVYVRNLSDLLYGFILGVTPLGYGLLLEGEDIHVYESERGDPKLFPLLFDRIKAIARGLPHLPFSFSNYQTHDEVADVHRNQRVTQYDGLMHIRRAIEKWVADQIPPDEANPVRVRQYQNAVLQYVGWLTKRHTWGMTAYKIMSEDEYKEIWLEYWVTQGLKESTLNKLYEGMEVWKKSILREKQKLSTQIQKARKALALLKP